jgi:hypothetical protein
MFRAAWTTLLVGVRHGTFAGAIGIAVGALMTAPAAAAGSAGLVLIDDTLAVTPIVRFSVEGDELVVWKRQAAPSASVNEPTLLSERLPLSRCIAVMRDASAPVGGSPVMILADGQRFPGEVRIRNDGSKDVGLGWKHRWFGDMSVEIDSLRALLLQPDARPPSSGAADRIVLANGDALDGVVLELGATIQLDRGAGEAATEVPLGRVAAIGFITPELPHEGHRMWCLDGTIVRASPRMDPESGLLVLERPRTPQPESVPESSTPRRAQPTPTARPDEVLGFSPAPARVKALAEVPPKDVATSGATPRCYVERPELTAGVWPLGAAPIAVRGPAVVRFAMPMKGCSVVAELEVVDADRRWTDFEIVVRDGTTEILRQHMEATSPAVALRATLLSDELSIEVTEGERGPIRDAIEIRRALLILPGA